MARRLLSSAPSGAPVRRCRVEIELETRHGYLRCVDHRSGWSTGTIVRAAEHFRQHRKLADHRLQRNRHELSGSGLPGVAEPADGRRRHRQLRRDQHRAGHHQITQVSTDMAINGDGWFVVAQPTGFTDNQPVFSGVTDFTRAGNFQLNDNGNLVNGCRVLSHGHPGQCYDRESRGQRSAGFAISKQFHPGARHHCYHLSGQPAERALLRSC